VNLGSAKKLLVGVALAGAVAWAADPAGDSSAVSATVSSAGASSAHYEVSWRKDLPLTAGAALVAIYGQYRYFNMEVPDEIIVRESGELLPWDRGFAGRYNKTADDVSKWSVALAVAPLGLAGYSWYAGDASGYDVGAFSLMFVQALALQSGVNFMVRSLELWPRPYVYAKNCEVADGRDRNCSADAVEKAKSAEGEAYGSFFSGHTSAAFTVAMFTGEWFSEMYPNSPYKNVVWAGAFSAAGMVGALRIAAGKHYPSDVIVGALVGTGISYGIISLHKNDGSRVSLWGGFNSAGLTLRF